MGIPIVDVFIAKSTVMVWAYVYDDDDALIDPTSMTITIRDPDGDVAVEDQAMTKKAVGQYYYQYRTSTLTTRGQYAGEILATDGSGETAIVTPIAFSFRIK